MKKEFPIRTMLGVSQKDLASLLGISKGHCSMFEQGKRGLPDAAKLKLAELLLQVQAPQTHSRKSAQSEESAGKHCKVIKQLLNDNQHFQAIIQRKLATARKKEEAAQRVSQVAGYFTSTASKGMPEPGIEHTIKAKAAAAGAIDHSLCIIKLELQLELRIHEARLLESKLAAFKIDKSREGEIVGGIA